MTELIESMRNREIDDDNAELIALLLKEREIFLKSNISVFRWAIEEDFTVTYVTENIIELLGYSQSEFVGNKMKPEDIVAAEMYHETAKYCYNKIFRSPAQEFDLEYICIGKNGRRIWVEDHTVIERNDSGNPIALWGFIRNISERKNAELKLVESELKFRDLFEKSNDSIFISDQTWKIVDVNKSGADLLGYEPKELVGRQFTRFLASIKTKKELLKEIKKNGFVKNFEIALRKKDKTIILCEMTSDRRNNATGSIVGYQSILRDISVRKEMEAKLFNSREELRNLSQHLQTIREEERAHIALEIHDELGQILTSMKMRIGSLKNNIGVLAQHDIEKRMESMTHLVDLVVGSVQRISQELRPSLLDDLGLPAAIQRELREFQNWSGIEYQLELDCKQVKIPGGHSTALFRVLQEALTNIARHAEATAVHVGLFCGPQKIEMRVADNGKGINKNEINNRKSLGLIGIRERIYFLNGKVSIEGRPGKGSVLKIIVPINENEASAREAADDPNTCRR